MVILLALYSFGGLVLAGMSVPLVLYKIRPNRWYGFPIRSSQENKQAWYRVNAYAGRRFLVVGLGTSLGAIILYYTSAQNVEQYALSCLGLFLALLLWAVISSFLFQRTIRE
jgi:hypothetical protein